MGFERSVALIWPRRAESRRWSFQRGFSEEADHKVDLGRAPDPASPYCPMRMVWKASIPARGVDPEPAHRSQRDCCIKRFYLNAETSNLPDFVVILINEPHVVCTCRSSAVIYGLRRLMQQSPFFKFHQHTSGEVTGALFDQIDVGQAGAMETDAGIQRIDAQAYLAK